ncbi:hypothetical protein NQ315_000459 [Exocentrus adspersus]|uniref:DDE Tnp4 domain-containing protein n=1 Tax=Exocentrus adspersus TaxID=1586481 RepID=A0AAV8VF32_9CUCU|nr:hypothetical protein NQ315_000459 [Exocentrus adspersus]
MGSESDDGVFSRSKFAKLLQSDQLHLPSPAYIGGFLNCLFPYFIVADEAFPLKENIMRPYPGKFLNKSRIIENTFGILSVSGPIIATVENIDKYVQATVCLHNYLKIWEKCNPKNTHKYCPPNYIDSDLNGNLQLGGWRQNIYDSQAMQPMGRLGSNNAKQKYFEIRNEMANYFLTDEGAVPWQDTYIRRGTKRQREN